jgi:hypothetical protein
MLRTVLAMSCTAAAFAPALLHAQQQLSPSEEFERATAPYKRPPLLLGAQSEYDQTAPHSSVRVITLGRRESPETRADDNQRLVNTIKAQQADERWYNGTFSHPEYEAPQPKTLTCNGSICSER